MSSRRQFVATTLGTLGAMTIPVSGFSSVPKLKVVCVGGHPDDPESGCGGTLIRFAQAGHEVTVIYLTRGEAGIEGKSHADAATIRTKESLAACEVMQVKPVFFGQTDGDTVFNAQAIDQMQKHLEQLKPDVVFTHWPLDEHRDHQVASLLTTQAWIRMRRSFVLYYFEACPGVQTFGFQPTVYCDISSVQEQKRRAVFCHTSQDPEGIYACGHTLSESFRGFAVGVKAAEAFIPADPARLIT